MAVARDDVTYLYAVPTVYESMLAVPDFEQHDLSSLRLLGGGTAYMPREQIERILRSFNVEQMLILYGQTEAGPVTCLRAHDIGSKAGSVGKPVTHAHVRIVDENGMDVPRGHPGEIVVSSEYTMLGYWKMPEATATPSKILSRVADLLPFHVTTCRTIIFWPAGHGPGGARGQGRRDASRKPPVHRGGLRGKGRDPS